MIKLFVSEHCPNCKRLKEKLDKEGAEYRMYDVGTVDGLAEHSYYNKNRMTMPLAVSVDNKGNLIADITDVIMEQK